MRMGSTAQTPRHKNENGNRSVQHKKGGAVTARKRSYETKAGENSTGNKGRRGKMSETMKHKRPIHIPETRRRHQRVGGTTDIIREQ
jgi:hypothetical protein